MSSLPNQRPNGRIAVSQAALFLDLDGTLAPFAPTPEAVVPVPARTETVRRACEALSGRVAVISGREITDVDRILEQASPHVAGVHGLQRRTSAGETISAAPHPELTAVHEILEAFATAWPGMRVENKGLSVAVHFRGHPAAAGSVGQLVRRLAMTTGLRLQEGDMVAELRTPGADKGDAVRSFLAEPRFAGGVPLYLGDDLTDEAGFAAAFDAGGAGILVGAPRSTSALGRLEGPEAALRWIDDSLDAGYFDLAATA